MGESSAPPGEEELPVGAPDRSRIFVIERMPPDGGYPTMINAALRAYLGANFGAGHQFALMTPTRIACALRRLAALRRGRREGPSPCRPACAAFTGSRTPRVPSPQRPCGSALKTIFASRIYLLL
jgi:hypothetical protein